MAKRKRVRKKLSPCEEAAEFEGEDDDDEEAEEGTETSRAKKPRVTKKPRGGRKSVKTEDPENPGVSLCGKYSECRPCLSPFVTL